MFSFFTKKSQNPNSPVIQGPSNETQNNGGDDYIFVEKKGDQPIQPQQPSHPIYPPMPPAPYGAAPYPRLPYGPAPAEMGGQGNLSPIPVSYVQDVPFVFAPQLCTKTTFENTQTEVDGILAFLTRQMSVDEEEYNFTLERSLQNES